MANTNAVEASKSSEQSPLTTQETPDSANQQDPTEIYRKLHQNADPDEEEAPRPRRTYEATAAQDFVATAPREWVGAAFANREEAEQAYQVLLEEGYNNNQINLLMTKETQQRYFPPETEPSALNRKAHESKLERAAEGTLQGTLIGTVLAVGSNFIFPGFGLFLGGPLFIGLGAITGGLKGLFAHTGIPEEQAARYEDDIQEGRIVMGVMARNKPEAERLRQQWANLSSSTAEQD